MKKLLLSSILLLGSVSLFAQDDCSTPLEAVEGTNSVAAPAGTFEAACFNITTDNAGGPLNGSWYTYTPATDGEVTINSNLLSNVAPNSVDTMVSVMTGTCGTLTCVASNDDVSATNYLSNVTFPVAAGVTYYIEWSNYWDGAGFDFDLTFTPITCLGIYEVDLQTNTTTSSVTLNWGASLSNPIGYILEYGAVGFAQGTGTTVTPATNTITLTGLAADTVYDYYISSNCETSQSAWTAVNKFTTAKICPEAAGFDNDTQLTGWQTAGNGAYGVGTTAANAQAGGQYWIFNNTVGAATNNWLISPPFSLQAGEQVTISFYERNATTGGTRKMRVTVGTAATTAAQTTQIYANTALLNNTYTQITTPVYTAPAAGIYYFGFNDNSAAATTAAATTMRFDTVNFTSVLGTNNFLSSKFSVFPNPAINVINFSNDQNAVVSTVEMTDLNGRTIKSLKVDATEGQISISDLATGMYMMKITTDQGVAVKKIVKQ